MRDIINEKYKYSEPQTKFIESSIHSLNPQG